jgi:MinD superfamily P-loop ATPase
MRIAIASGKGGTGKTTVAVNLAITAVREGCSVHLCDCDVEEPNAHLFLDPEFQRTWPVTVPVPLVDQKICQHCGECADICEFNAIASLPEKTMIFPDLCHGCSGCWLVCPTLAITPGARPLGEVSTGFSGELAFTRGRLQIGETLVPPLIEAVKQVPGDESWIILDAPPGVTCPVVTTAHGADLVLLVTEPTPFGLHDLSLAVDLTRKMDIPCGVVINRAGGTRNPVDDFCACEGIEILARIPFRRRVAEACAEGCLALNADAEVAAALAGLFENLRSREVWV